MATLNGYLVAGGTSMVWLQRLKDNRTGTYLDAAAVTSATLEGVYDVYGRLVTGTAGLPMTFVAGTLADGSDRKWRAAVPASADLEEDTKVEARALVILASGEQMPFTAPDLPVYASGQPT